MHELCARLEIPSLGELGLAETDVPEACRAGLESSSMKGNPVALDRQALYGILLKAL